MKELFFKLSDNADLQDYHLPNLNEIRDYIETDLGNMHPDERELVVYTIQPVLMTQEEFDNLPEYQF